MSWVEKIEQILSAYGIDYDAIRMECDAKQLPAKYIVYNLSGNEAKNHYDGNLFSENNQISVSFYSKIKADVIDFPDDLKNQLKSQEFLWSNSFPMPYQTETGHYGITAIFNYYETR